MSEVSLYAPPPRLHVSKGAESMVRSASASDAKERKGGRVHKRVSHHGRVLPLYSETPVMTRLGCSGQGSEGWLHRK